MYMMLSPLIYGCIVWLEVIPMAKEDAEFFDWADEAFDVRDKDD